MTEETLLKKVNHYTSNETVLQRVRYDLNLIDLSRVNDVFIFTDDSQCQIIYEDSNGHIVITKHII